MPLGGILTGSKRSFAQGTDCGAIGLGRTGRASPARDESCASRGYGPPRVRDQPGRTRRRVARARCPRFCSSVGSGPGARLHSRPAGPIDADPLRSQAAAVNDTRLAPRHLAVVPIASVDRDTLRTLRYAASLAQHVFAMHIRAAGDSARLQDEWSQRGECLPLLVVDASNNDRAITFCRAIGALKCSEQPEQITVVLPPREGVGSGVEDWRDSLASDAAVVVRRMPGRPTRTTDV
jgi:hypothetical protein